MLVKIISGTYGHSIGSKVVAKDRRSEPFELGSPEAERIIELGIAEAIEDENIAPHQSSDADSFPPRGSLGGQSRTPVPTNGNFLDAEQLASLTNKELKELAENLGIDTSKMKRKDDYIKAICELNMELDADDEGNMIPDLGAEAIVL